MKLLRYISAAQGAEELGAAAGGSVRVGDLMSATQVRGTGALNIELILGKTMRRHSLLGKRR